MKNVGAFRFRPITFLKAGDHFPTYPVEGAHDIFLIPPETFLQDLEDKVEEMFRCTPAS